MRSFSIVICIAFLSGCAIQQDAATQLIPAGTNTSRVNAVSNVNKQLSSTSKPSEQHTFSGCLAIHPHKQVNTLAKKLTSDKSGSHSPAPVTITSDNLSVYVASLWNYTKQNKDMMLQVLALHRAHDKTCFEREIMVLKNGGLKSGTNVNFSDYDQSHKILGNIYDYLHSTVSVTEYSELDEQFARDHIPVRVLLPTS